MCACLCISGYVNMLGNTFPMQAGVWGQRFIYGCVCQLFLYFWDRVLLLNLEFAELAGQESFQDPPLFPIVQVTSTHCHTWILNGYWWSKFRTSHLVSKYFIPCSISTAHTTSFCLMHSYTIFLLHNLSRYRYWSTFPI